MECGNLSLYGHVTMEAYISNSLGGGRLITLTENQDKRSV